MSVTCDQCGAVERLEAMLADTKGETWDLSPNDREAIQIVLAERESWQAAIERLRAELVPVAYTKDGVPVRVGMPLYKVWQGHLKSGCAFFMVDMGGIYLDVTAAFSSEKAALAEEKDDDQKREF